MPIRWTPRRWGNMSRGTAAMRWRAFWLSSKSARPNSKDNNLTSPRLSMGRRFRLFGRFLDHHLLVDAGLGIGAQAHHHRRSEEHTSELQSLMRISYAVFCLKKKNKINKIKKKNK